MAVTLTKEQIVASYNSGVEERISLYESLDFEETHPQILPYLPEPPAAALDIGAGSGRDATYLSKRGYTVTAVEPAKEFLSAAAETHKESQLRWVNDSLPALEQLKDDESVYDVILLSAVWMHLSQAERKASFETLVRLLKPGGIVMILYKIGGSEAEGFYVVDHGQFDKGAERVGLKMLYQEICPDSLGRRELSWRCCILEKE